MHFSFELIFFASALASQASAYSCDTGNANHIATDFINRGTEVITVSSDRVLETYGNCRLWGSAKTQVGTTSSYA